jgi:lipopolysaccharide transport system ATP-binding protein
MSSDVVIKVEGLGKRYSIRHEANGRGGYQTFREMVTARAMSPMRALKSRLESKKERTGNGSDNLISDLGSLTPSRATREDFWALKDVSFEVKRGEVLGIIGRNGAGKTTLLKILSRITEPTEGRVRIKGRVASLLEVGTGFHPELTGRENIYLNGAILGMSKAEIKKKFDEIVAFAETEKFLDTPVKRYSSGMYVRLAFAVAAHLEPEILVVDEVLAVGDAEFQKKCLGKMQDVSTKEGRTVLFVSHSMGAISHLCGKGIVLNNGQIFLYGTAEQAIDAYNDIALKHSSRGSDLPSHVLYSAPQDREEHDFAITRIEILDPAGHPKALIRTWDDVVFRVLYRCKRAVARGSVVLDFFTLDGKRLLFLGTEIADMSPINFRVGAGRVDCFIRKLPFAGGDYVMGAGLAIKQVEWLWRNDSVAKFHVVAHDVYGSGHTLVTSDCLIAVEHRWNIGECRD